MSYHKIKIQQITTTVLELEANVEVEDGYTSDVISQNHRMVGL